MESFQIGDMPRAVEIGQGVTIYTLRCEQRVVSSRQRALPQGQEGHFAIITRDLEHIIVGVLTQPAQVAQLLEHITTVHNSASRPAPSFFISSHPTRKAAWRSLYSTAQHSKSQNSHTASTNSLSHRIHRETKQYLRACERGEDDSK